MNKGILYGVSAYVLWGFFPIYWKLLHRVSAFQVIGHRIVWSFIVLILFIFITRQWKEFRRAGFKSSTLGIYTVAGILLTINWLIYVYGVNSDQIVQTSLGYFINPLLSVLLGVVFLRERLRPAQWVAVGLAALGVIWLAAVYGHLPLIALSLAFSFGFYGLIKKLAPLGSLFGLTLETGLLFPFALIYLAVMQMGGQGAFLQDGLQVGLLLAGAGVVTTIPLLLFASAAQRIPLTMVGVLQYIAPTIQFLIGVFFYREPFDVAHLIGFCIVWFALLIFGVDGIMTKRIQAQIIPELGEG